MEEVKLVTDVVCICIAFLVPRNIFCSLEFNGVRFFISDLSLALNAGFLLCLFHVVFVFLAFPAVTKKKSETAIVEEEGKMGEVSNSADFGQSEGSRATS